MTGYRVGSLYPGVVQPKDQACVLLRQLHTSFCGYTRAEEVRKMLEKM